MADAFNADELYAIGVGISAKYVASHLYIP